jgi:histone demethylase JARID1
MKCLRINKKKFDHNEGFDCPICDWRKDIPRSSPRPSLAEMKEWEQAAAKLPFCPNELDLVLKINTNAEAWVASIHPFIQDRTKHTIAKCRFYLRKIEGAELFLPNEYNTMRHFAHALAPVTTTPPPLIAESKVIKKPRAKKPKPEPESDPQFPRFTPYDPVRSEDPIILPPLQQQRPLAMELSQIAPQPHQPTQPYVPKPQHVPPQPAKGTFAPPPRATFRQEEQVRQGPCCGSCDGPFVMGTHNEPLACSQCRRLHHTLCIGKYGGRLYPASVWYLPRLLC